MEEQIQYLQTYFCPGCHSEFAVLIYHQQEGQPIKDYRDYGPKACPICDSPGALIEALNTRTISGVGAHVICQGPIVERS